MMKQTLHLISPPAIEDAWKNLAADILLCAIQDARQNGDLEKREWAKAWLKSPAATLFLDEIINPHFDIMEWVDANCPILDNNE